MYGENDNNANYFKNLLKSGKPQKKQIAVYLDDETLDRMDKITKQFSEISGTKSFSRNSLIEEAINKYIEDSENFLRNELGDDSVRDKEKSNISSKRQDKPPENKNADSHDNDEETSSLEEDIKNLKIVEELIELYDNQEHGIRARRAAHIEDKNNNVTFYALTETRVLHDSEVVSDWSGLSGESQAYYMPEHAKYIVRGGKTTLEKHGRVEQTLNGKSFDPGSRELPIGLAKLGISKK